MTKEELWKHGNAWASANMIAMLGEVFDVSRSPKYYGVHFVRAYPE